MESRRCVHDSRNGADNFVTKCPAEGIQPAVKLHLLKSESPWIWISHSKSPMLCASHISNTRRLGAAERTPAAGTRRISAELRANKAWLTYQTL